MSASDLLALAERAEIIANASWRGIASFEGRVKERKGRLTWWAVNELQDYLACAAVEADRIAAALRARASTQTEETRI